MNTENTDAIVNFPLVVTRTERGWPGHFICSNRCFYRRNTLLQTSITNLIVSSVGNLHEINKSEPQPIGHNRFYETMVFVAKQIGPYLEADVHATLEEGSPSFACGEFNTLPADIDSLMDTYHEERVAFWAQRLQEGFEYAEFSENDEDEEDENSIDWEPDNSIYDDIEEEE